MPRFERLARLFHHRWAVPVLAELARSDGARFVALVHRLGASPGAVRMALDDLAAMELAGPNPGYGHPLRPEYVLAPGARRLAATCRRLDDAVRTLRVAEVAFRKWSMPVLVAVGEGPTRFSVAARRLGAVTDRALALALAELGEAGLIERQPRQAGAEPDAYGATTTGMELVPILGRL